MDLTHSGKNREEWRKPLPLEVPRPTYWPAALALAITLVLVGPVTLMVVSLAGLILGAFALAGWIGEMIR